MLPSAHGDKRRKKTGATYGKAVRRRGPSHLVSGFDLRNEFQEKKLELPVRAVADKAPKRATVPSSKRPSPTTHTDVFDFPFDSDDEVLSPAPSKKRKLSAIPAKHVSKMSNQHEPRTIKPALAPHGDSFQASPESDFHKYATETKSRSRAGSRCYMPTKVASSIRQRTVDQDLPRSTKSSSPVERPSIKPATNLKGYTQAFVHREPLQGKVTVLDSMERPAPTSPSQVTMGLQSECESSPRHISPPILTPKSAKTWKALLGDDSETSKTSKTEDKSAATTEKPARRRLIDTLAQQKRKATPKSERPQDNEESDNKSIPVLHVVSQNHQISRSEAAIQPSQPSVTTASSSVPTAGGPRITYSRQRSMLTEQDGLLGDIHLGSQRSKAVEIDLQQRSELLPAIFRSSNMQADEDSEDSAKPPAIRSVHELRQAGASKRFMDEVDDLSDRVTATSSKPSIRRSALLELLNKVQDKTFLRNLLASGAEQRILATMGEENDAVSGFLLASVLLVLLDPSATQVSPSRLVGFGFVPFCRRFIKISDSIVYIAKQRKTNMSKVATTAIGDCQRKLLDLPIWGDGPPSSLSPRTMVLACLALALPQTSEKGKALTLVPEDMVEELFSILQPHTTHLLDPSKKSSQCDLLLSMSVLGHCYLPHTGKSGQPQWAPEHLRKICCVATKLLASGEDEVAILRKVVLSLTLNITNNNGHATSVFATPSFMHAILRSVVVEFGVVANAYSERERMVSLDTLILMLGIMINLAEKQDDNRAHILDSSSLKDALQIFSTHAEKSFEADSVEDSHFNVVFGYLAVLLGYLSLMEHLAEPIRTALPGRSLQLLIDAIKEFIHHHQQVDALLENDPSNHRAHTALTERLSLMLGRVCKIETDLTQGRNR